MFKKNLRYLRHKSGTSQDALAAELGYKSFTTVQKWEDGTSVPPYRKLEKIADLYGVTVYDLMNMDLSYNDRGIPVLGTVRGGEPIFAEQMVSEYEPIDIDASHSDEYFCLDVIGDSMKDVRILPGDRLFVHKQDRVENREIAVVLIGDEATVKRVVYDQDRLVLQPENEAYQPIVLTESDQEEKGVRILGKVVYNKIRY